MGRRTTKSLIWFDLIRNFAFKSKEIYCRSRTWHTSPWPETKGGHVALDRSSAHHQRSERNFSRADAGHQPAWKRSDCCDPLFQEHPCKWRSLLRLRLFSPRSSSGRLFVLIKSLQRRKINFESEHWPVADLLDLWTSVFWVWPQQAIEIGEQPSVLWMTKDHSYLTCPKRKQVQNNQCFDHLLKLKIPNFGIQTIEYLVKLRTT